MTRSTRPVHRCALYNAQDVAAESGAGPRLLLSTEAQQRTLEATP